MSPSISKSPNVHSPVVSVVGFLQLPGTKYDSRIAAAAELTPAAAPTRRTTTLPVKSLSSGLLTACTCVASDGPK